MLRRCLDCDCTFTTISQCPRCASANTLIIDDPAEPGMDLPRGGALLILIHALVVTVATGQAPGLLLGSCLFFNGLCAVLLLLGVERAPQFLRCAAAFSVVFQVCMIAITGQALLFLPGLVMVTACTLLLYQDSTAGWLRPTLAIAVTGAVLLIALTAAAAYGVALPAWWQGRYLFRDRELPLPIPVRDHGGSEADGLDPLPQPERP